MYFNIQNVNVKEEALETDFLANRSDKKNLEDWLKNTCLVKKQVKAYLKNDKYIKFSSNGSDYIKLTYNKRFEEKVDDKEAYIKKLLNTCLSNLINDIKIDDTENRIKYTKFLEYYIEDNNKILVSI